MVRSNRRLLSIVQRNQRLYQQKLLSQKEHHGFSSLPINEQTRSRGKPHPRNSFAGTYDMDRLIAAYPSLSPHVVRTRLGKPCRPTIDFANPDAVRALNTALLVSDYQVNPKYSDILPSDALVPPVPGRADYVHHVADVLQLSSPSNTIPTGKIVVGMDIGTGASAIYPTIATSVYGWKMIASEINSISTESAKKIVKANGHMESIDVRQQDLSDRSIFDGVLRPGEKLDFAMCNPPFYPSSDAFMVENARKLKGLAKGGFNRVHPNFSLREKQLLQGRTTSNNFGGTDSELWCEGGEVSFVKLIVNESKNYSNRCLWFSSLVSRKVNLNEVEKSLSTGRNKSDTKQPKVQDVLRKQIGAGHKSATILFWTYFDEKQRVDWARMRDWG